jgi:hypothetical protein
MTLDVFAARLGMTLAEALAARLACPPRAARRQR